VLVDDKSESRVVRKLVEAEYESLRVLSQSHRTVDVVKDSLQTISWMGVELGAGYLMSNIGEPVLPSDCVQRNKLTGVGRLVLQSLCHLHADDKVAHGDARIHNVVWDPAVKAYKWIDFMQSSSISSEGRICDDLSLLLNTMLPVKVEAGEISRICSLNTMDLKYDAIEALLAPVSSTIPSASL
jgi:hypothetical protein